MLKKISKFALAFWLVYAVFGSGHILGAQSASAANTLFPDVSNDNRYFLAISYLKDLGVISGYGDMTFKPDNPVTRAEFLKLVMMHAEKKNMGPKKILPDAIQEFTDVKAGDWFADYIKKAAKFAIVKGYSDNSFKPNSNVTLAEGLKMIYLSHDINVPTMNIKESPFPDMRASNWALPYAKFSFEKNVILMDANGKLNAEKNLTRAETAELIYRVYAVSSKLLAPFDLSGEWNIYENKLQNFSAKIPTDWQIIPEQTRTVLWQKDAQNNQTDYEYISPLAAKIVIRTADLTDEDLKAGVYFEKVKSFSKQVFPAEGIKFEETTINGNNALHIIGPSLSSGPSINNWYIIVNEFAAGAVKGAKKALIIYAEAGNGTLNKQFEKIIQLAALNVKYLPGNYTPEQLAQIEALMNKINAAIGVEKQWSEIIKEVNDQSIIETDAIGVGTGPVDYYYSKKLNLTIKVERATNTILATRGGKTAKF